MKNAALRIAVVAAALALSQPAAAHQSNPDFESNVRSLSPQTDGLSATVTGGDDAISVVNRSGRSLVAFGYEQEPYVRIDGDGSVFVNLRSPAHYLNQERLGKVEVPAEADADAAPRWKRVSGEFEYQWHDHRIHWMGDGKPAAVGDESRRTKIFDWRVPYRIGDRDGSINGDLYWRGEPAQPSGAPWIAIAAVPVLLLLGGAAVLVRRRRDRPAEGVA